MKTPEASHMLKFGHGWAIHAGECLVLACSLENGHSLPSAITRLKEAVAGGLREQAVDGLRASGEVES